MAGLRLKGRKHILGCTKGGPIGPHYHPRGSKRGQRITKKSTAVRRSNTLSSLSLIHHPLRMQPPHSTHALGCHLQSVQQSPTRTPSQIPACVNLRTVFSLPSPSLARRRIGRSNGLLKLWIHERRVLVSDTCLVVLLHPEREIPMLYKRGTRTRGGRLRSAGGCCRPLAQCDRWAGRVSFGRA